MEEEIPEILSKIDAVLEFLATEDNAEPNIYEDDLLKELNAKGVKINKQELIRILKKLSDDKYVEHMGLGNVGENYWITFDGLVHYSLGGYQAVFYQNQNTQILQNHQTR